MADVFASVLRTGKEGEATPHEKKKKEVIEKLSNCTAHSSHQPRATARDRDLTAALPTDIRHDRSAPATTPPPPPLHGGIPAEPRDAPFAGGGAPRWGVPALADEASAPPHLRPLPLQAAAGGSSPPLGDSI